MEDTAAEEMPQPGLKSQVALEINWFGFDQFPFDCGLSTRTGKELPQKGVIENALHGCNTSYKGVIDMSAFIN